MKLNKLREAVKLIKELQLPDKDVAVLNGRLAKAIMAGYDSAERQWEKASCELKKEKKQVMQKHKLGIQHCGSIKEVKEKVKQNLKPIVILKNPFETHKAVERHLRKYGHLPTTDLCDEEGSCMKQIKTTRSRKCKCDNPSIYNPWANESYCVICGGKVKEKQPQPSYSRRDREVAREEIERDYRESREGRIR